MEKLFFSQKKKIAPMLIAMLYIALRTFTWIVLPFASSIKVLLTINVRYWFDTAHWLSVQNAFWSLLELLIVFPIAFVVIGRTLICNISYFKDRAFSVLSGAFIAVDFVVCLIVFFCLVWIYNDKLQLGLILAIHFVEVLLYIASLVLSRIIEKN